MLNGLFKPILKFVSSSFHSESNNGDNSNNFENGNEDKKEEYKNIPEYIKCRKCDKPCKNVHRFKKDEDLQDYSETMKWCSECNPSNDNVKYIYNIDLGWIVYGYRNQCLLCKKELYWKTNNKYLICEECDHDDPHYIFYYDKEFKCHGLVKMRIYSYNTHMHEEKLAFINGKLEECTKCTILETHLKQEKKYLELKRKHQYVTYPSNKENITNVYPVVNTNSLDFIDLDEFRLSNSSSSNPNNSFSNSSFSYNSSNSPDSFDKDSSIYRIKFFNRISARIVNSSKKDNIDKSISKNIEKIEETEEIKINKPIKRKVVKAPHPLSNPIKFLQRYVGEYSVAELILDYTDRVFPDSNLSNLNLRNAEYSGYDFSDSNFTNSDLANVNFNYTNLSKANFTASNLYKATLKGCKCHETIFAGANLTSSDLSFLFCEKTNFSHAVLDHAICISITLDKYSNIIETSFVSTDFSCSNLSFIDFTFSKMSKCFFYNTRLVSTNLFGFDFTDTEFVEGDFDFANFSCAILDKSYFENISFNSAILKCTKLKKCLFENCVFKSTNFTFANLEEAKFNNCLLKGVIFDNGSLKETKFDDCIVRRLSLEGCDLTKNTVNGMS